MSVFSFLFNCLYIVRYGGDRVAVTASVWLMLLAWSPCLPPTCPVNINVKLLDCYGRWQNRQGVKGFDVCVFRRVGLCVFSDCVCVCGPIKSSLPTFLLQVSGGWIYGACLEAWLTTCWTLFTYSFFFHPRTDSYSYSLMLNFIQILLSDKTQTIWSFRFQCKPKYRVSLLVDNRGEAETSRLLMTYRSYSTSHWDWKKQWGVEKNCHHCWCVWWWICQKKSAQHNTPPGSPEATYWQILCICVWTHCYTSEITVLPVDSLHFWFSVSKDWDWWLTSTLLVEIRNLQTVYNT